MSSQGWPGRRGRVAVVVAVAAAALGLTACAGADVGSPRDRGGDAGQSADNWAATVAQSSGQVVNLWMYGGDQQGNAYVDDILAPAAAELGVELNRVPVADTADALNRVLSELQAGRTDDGSVDLVWVNGENFRSGQDADAWLCDWTQQLPSMRYVDPTDPLLTSDFGVPVEGCEAPWHKALFVFAYDSADVQNPPRTMDQLFTWIEDHPGRFTHPAPPDFTGSAFLRQALYGVAGGPDDVPAQPGAGAYERMAPPLWDRLSELAPSLWREGSTYPRDLSKLEDLYAGDQVDFTMTYGPSTLDHLVATGTFPDTTRVLQLDDGTLGNASFLAIPVNAANQAGAKVVTNLALSPEQQLAKANPDVWGQYSVLDLQRVPPDVRNRFRALPSSAVVPPFTELSSNAQPELAAEWVRPLEEGWRSSVLTTG